MRVIHRLEAQGAFLFRWRSFLPLLLIPLGVPALFEAAHIESIIGEELDDMLSLGCFFISLSGLALRAVTVGFVLSGTSGRNTSEQRANVLNTTGLYSIVRNPLYLGNFIVIFGVVLAIKVWWFIIIVALMYWLYIERIIAVEEAYLSAKFGKDYDNWVRTTPCFVPRFSLWKSPAEKFSLRTVLRREYNGLFVLVLVYLFLDILTDTIADNESVATWAGRDYLWLGIAAVGTVIFFSLRTLKKRTRFLHVEGR